MARPKKVQKVKEPVRIRKRKLANGNMSLYLDVYVKGVRKVESLGLYLVPEQTPIDKQQNAHAMQVAGKIKAERILALQNHGVRQWNKVKRSCITLIDFLKEYEQEKFGFSASTLKGRRDERQTGLAAQSRNLSKRNVPARYCAGQCRCGLLPWLHRVSALCEKQRAQGRKHHQQRGCAPSSGRVERGFEQGRP